MAEKGSLLEIKQFNTKMVSLKEIKGKDQIMIYLKTIQELLDKEFTFIGINLTAKDQSLLSGMGFNCNGELNWSRRNEKSPYLIIPMKLEIYLVQHIDNKTPIKAFQNLPDAIEHVIINSTHKEE